jgi:hypothetical protein
MTFQKGRKLAAAVALLGLIVLGVSMWVMFDRVRRFHEESPRQLFAFQPIVDRAFTFEGREVSLTDDKADPANPKLIVRYGDHTLPLDVAVPGRYELPGLLSHTDWLRVLRFMSKSGLTEEQFQQRLNSGEDRLAIVTRTPPKGVDPKTWGSVWKKAWVFDFYEFKKDGTIEHQQLRFPSKSGTKRPIEGELHENTWEFQAALHLMPNAGQTGPTRNFYGDALAAAGWSLPVAAFAGLAACFGLAFLFAPRKRTD